MIYREPYVFKHTLIKSYHIKIFFIQNKQISNIKLFNHIIKLKKCPLKKKSN